MLSEFLVIVVWANGSVTRHKTYGHSYAEAVAKLDHLRGNPADILKVEALRIEAEAKTVGIDTGLPVAYLPAMR